MQIKSAVNTVRSALKRLCDKMVLQVYGLYPSLDDLDAGINVQEFISDKANHLKMSGEYMHTGRDEVSGIRPFTFS